MSAESTPDTELSQRPIGSTVRLTDQELTDAADLIENGDGDLIADEVILALLGEIRELRADREKVRAHIDERPEYITACTDAGPESEHDYYRWQGGAEARRQIAQRLGWTVPYEPGEKTGPKPTTEEHTDAQ